MNKLILIGIFFMNHCITTVAPGILYNSTIEHIYPSASRNQLGTGRLEIRAETCAYNSVFLRPFYYSQTASIESLMAEHKIKKIGVVDYSSFSIFGAFIYSNCIIIWGEP